MADWLRTLMIHYEVDPVALQRVVPFQLDLREGHAFISVVAFTLSRMRPRLGGRLTAWLLKPISAHDFLNVRTYVRVNGETGIYFMAEWLSNRLSVALGPRAFGLPYRLGRIEYNCHDESLRSSSSSDPHVIPSFRSNTLSPISPTGHVEDTRTGCAFAFTTTLKSNPRFLKCEPDSLSEWLMERYTAFTGLPRKRRFFRVWHQPWPQLPADVYVTEKSLLDENWPFFRDSRLVGANFSPGVTDVWMGWPHRVPD